MCGCVVGVDLGNFCEGVLGVGWCCDCCVLGLELGVCGFGCGLF